MRLLVLAMVVLMSLAGCSDDGDDAPEASSTQTDTGTSSPPPPEPVSVQVTLTGAYPLNIAYAPARIEVPAGSNVTLTFRNTDTNPLISHDWALEGFEDIAQTATIGQGESATITFLAPPAGEYAFYCSVPGHRSNGMEGVFVVT